MPREIVPASKEYEKEFRRTYQLRAECREDPECEAAFEHAATTKLYSDELEFIGAIVEKAGE